MGERKRSSSQVNTPLPLSPEIGGEIDEIDMREGE
jgi:hypothetical protein